MLTWPLTRHSIRFDPRGRFGAFGNTCRRTPGHLSDRSGQAAPAMAGVAHHCSGPPHVRWTDVAGSRQGPIAIPGHRPSSGPWLAPEAWPLGAARGRRLTSCPAPRGSHQRCRDPPAPYHSDLLLLPIWEGFLLIVRHVWVIPGSQVSGRQLASLPSGLAGAGQDQPRDGLGGLVIHLRPHRTTERDDLGPSRQAALVPHTSYRRMSTARGRSRTAGSLAFLGVAVVPRRSPHVRESSCGC